MKWKIDNVCIDNQIVLAPMAGVCDSAFRCIIKSMGCGLLSGEMVSATAIAHCDNKTSEMLYMNQQYERPISQQIFGSDVNSFKIASRYVYNTMKPDIIDINMGCPVSKVAVKSNSGAAILKNPKKAYEITKALVDTLPIPVTVKIRSGWDKNSINAMEIASKVEKAGASAITIHPRHRNQPYSQLSDWNLIREIKNELSIPVIGNGDIKTCFDAYEMLNFTNCDAVMIGRGVLGNPWLIKECIDYLQNQKHPQNVSLKERFDMIKKHTELLIRQYGEIRAIKKMRSHVAYYVKGLRKSIEFKPKIFKVKTKKELFSLIDDYYAFLKDY